MITEKQKKAIIKSIGSKHITKIAAYALSKNVKKEDGLPFSNSAFSQVLNGRLEHPDIEAVIFDCADFYFNQNVLKEKKKQDFVEKVKFS